MLPRRYRLKNNRSFNYIYRKGKSIGGAFTVLLYTEARGSLLVGFSVSKKIGGSVTRNLVKRRMREALRTFLPNVKQGHHLIFVARSGIENVSFTKLVSTLEAQVNKAGLLTNRGENETALH